MTTSRVAALGRALGASLLGAATLACAEAAPQPRLAEVSDSAGVRIVMNTDPVWNEDTRWTIDPEPVLHIGAADGDQGYQFGQVATAQRMANGNVVVVDQMTQHIVMFDSDGRFLQRLGGRGKGPGEFTALFRVLRLPSDSFLAWDSQHNRGTVYSADGVRRRDFTATSAGTRYGRPDLMLRLPDGRFVAGTESSPPIETEGYTQRHGGYWRAAAIVSPEGAIVDTIGEYSISPCPGIQRECSHTMFAPSGTFTATTDRLYYGFGDAIDIAVFDLNGRLTQRIRRTVEPVRVTTAATDSIIDAIVARSQPAARESRAERLRANPVDSVMPLFRSLMSDADGNLWVGMITGPYQMRPIFFEDIRLRFMPARPLYSVYDTAGVYLGDLETPPRFSIMELGTDYMLGVWLDEMDVEYVRMYRLIKPGKH